MKTLTQLLLTALAAAALAAPALAAGPIIVVPNGAVQVRTGLTGEWQALAANRLVAPGQSVRTDKSSTAELRFSDGSRVQLAPDTVFSIDKTDAKEATFSLGFGRIRAAFAGLISSRVSIRTPSSVCAVRGTVFEIGADDKNTDVTMAEGVLEVTDHKGAEAVLTSEETLRIGENGMEKPHLVALGGDHALGAVRPYAVHQEMARDASRTMIEDMRNRELKANEAQLGKDAIDAFGRRVRIEEYLLRPSPSSFELLFLSHRSDRFDWGHLIETFHAAIPDDVSQVGAIIDATYFSPTMPANWLTGMEFFATNTQDSIKEVISLADPIAIDFSGYKPGLGVRFYPESIDYTQTLSGPGLVGLPGAVGDTRDQFYQHQDFGQTNAGMFTFAQAVPDGDPLSATPGQLAFMFVAAVDPTNPLSVSNPTVLAGGAGDFNYDHTNTYLFEPNGPDKADRLAITVYPDNSIVSTEKFLVSNDGKLFDFAKPDPAAFSKEGNYNLELNIGSSLFQGRDIDVLIAPEILSQTGNATKTAQNLNP